MSQGISASNKRYLAWGGILAGLVALGAVGRLVGHPANVTPVAAAALFAGFLLPRRWVACAVPLASLALSDLWLDGYDWRIATAVYGALCLPALLGGLLKNQVTVARLVGCSLAASTLFFVISNGAEFVWGKLYSFDSAGLSACFTAALPFYRNMVAGDLVFTALLFSLHSLACQQWIVLDAPRALAAERVRR